MEIIIDTTVDTDEDIAKLLKAFTGDKSRCGCSVKSVDQSSSTGTTTYLYDATKVREDLDSVSSKAGSQPKTSTPVEKTTEPEPDPEPEKIEETKDETPEPKKRSRRKPAKKPETQTETQESTPVEEVEELSPSTGAPVDYKTAKDLLKLFQIWKNKQDEKNLIAMSPQEMVSKIKKIHAEFQGKSTVEKLSEAFKSEFVKAESK